MEQIDEIIFEEPRKTFMEILKVHKLEVPFANLLGFFFRPKEKHGLGTLFLEALLNTRCSDIGPTENLQTESIVRNRGYKKSGASPDLNLDADTIQVVVEQKTQGDKRIDILIYSNDFVICIEFKINHDLDNPLHNYKAYVEKHHKGKQHHFIVLTPFKKKAIGAAKLFFDEENTKFKQVILSHFFSQIQVPASYLAENEHNDYYRNLCDLVQTVKNRKIRSMRFYTFSTLKTMIIKEGWSCECNQKHGSFIELKDGGFAIKLRIKHSSWQLEKWVGKDRVTTKVIDDNSIGYKALVNEIISFTKNSRLSQSTLAM